MYKYLYLLRHADAVAANNLPDIKRHLSPKGIEECKVIASYLEKNTVKQNNLKQNNLKQDDLKSSTPKLAKLELKIPEMALVSSALRTKQTAKEVLRPIKNIDVVFNKTLYSATAPEIFKEIAKVPNTINSLMIIAHNPTVAELFSILLKNSTIRPEQLSLIAKVKGEYRPCTLSIFGFNMDNWLSPLDYSANLIDIVR